MHKEKPKARGGEPAMSIASSSSWALQHNNVGTGAYLGSAAVLSTQDASPVRWRGRVPAWLPGYFPAVSVLERVGSERERTDRPF